MEDYFALLDEPRRPWLDPRSLKARFLERSAAVHPDHVHDAPPAERTAANARFAALNTAHATLAEPHQRLLHLLTLERGQPPADVQRIPPGTMDLFMEVGQVCHEVDAFLARPEPADSPMLKLQRFKAGLDRTGRIQAMLGKVRAKRVGLEAELPALNPVWETAPAPGDPARAAALPLDRLEQLYRGLSYVTRWTGQLQERLGALAR